MTVRIEVSARRIPDDRLNAACNQAAVQFHGCSFSDLDARSRMRLRKRIRFVLLASTPDIVLQEMTASHVLATHYGHETYVDPSEGAEGTTHVTCKGCDWDAVLEWKPENHHARHLAEMLAEAS